MLSRGSFGMTGACDGTGKCIYTNAFSVRCLLLARYPATYGAGRAQGEVSSLSPKAAVRCVLGFENFIAN